jgi:replicative DNA helicase Mcm
MLNSGEVVLEESMTPYDTATLRKYIAYAKSHVFPIGDEQTDTLILDHYVRIRGLSGKDKPITIAPRQLEALVRLSEASARVRLSDHIKIEDVKRALTIFDTCMKQVAYDSETGTFDIDRVMTSTPKKTRDNVVALLEIVRKHADELGYAAREQVKISLMATGKPIDEAEALIDKALQTTVIMEPRRGYLKVV